MPDKSRWIHRVVNTLLALSLVFLAFKAVRNFLLPELGHAQIVGMVQSYIVAIGVAAAFVLVPLGFSLTNIIQQIGAAGKRRFQWHPWRLAGVLLVTNILFAAIVLIFSPCYLTCSQIGKGALALVFKKDLFGVTFLNKGCDITISLGPWTEVWVEVEGKKSTLAKRAECGNGTCNLKLNAVSCELSQRSYDSFPFDFCAARSMQAADDKVAAVIASGKTIGYYAKLKLLGWEKTAIRPTVIAYFEKEAGFDFVWRAFDPGIVVPEPEPGRARISPQVQGDGEKAPFYVEIIPTFCLNGPGQEKKKDALFKHVTIKLDDKARGVFYEVDCRYSPHTASTARTHKKQ